MSTTDLPFRAKLYRYFFFDWMLRQPEGDLFLRSSVLRGNRERLARWLPHYARVHLVGAALCMALLWLPLRLEGNQTLIAVMACVGSAEVCLMLATLGALLALKLQNWAGDIERD